MLHSKGIINILDLLLLTILSLDADYTFSHDGNLLIISHFDLIFHTGVYGGKEVLITTHVVIVPAIQVPYFIIVVFLNVANVDVKICKWLKL